MNSSSNKTVAIVVNYNAGEWLRRCLSSLNTSGVSHTYVVDNRSTDLSLDYIQPLLEAAKDTPSLPPISMIENLANVGFAKANNQILTNVLSNDIDCEYILLINPDCEIQTDVLPKLIKEFEQRSDFGMLGCIIKNEDGSIQNTCRRNFPTPKSAILKLLLLDKFTQSNEARVNLGSEVPETFIETQALSGAFMLVRKQALKDVGLLDESYFMHCEDLDWCMRFKHAEWKIDFSPKTSIIHAKGVSSKSRPIRVLWTLHKGMARFFDKFYKHEYSLPYRLFVKLGIYAAFTLRATLTGLKILVFQGKGKTASLPRRYR